MARLGSSVNERLLQEARKRMKRLNPELHAVHMEGSSSAELVIRAATENKRMLLSRIAFNQTIEDRMRTDAKYRRALEKKDRPILSVVREKANAELMAWLEGHGLKIDEGSFKDLAERFPSAEELADWLVEDRQLELLGFDSDFFWMALAALWERWAPERPSYEMVDLWMRSGYEHSQAQDAVAASTLWLKVWRAVLKIMDDHDVQSIKDFDLRFRGTQSLYNWVQDVELKLSNAGYDDDRLYHEGIRFCEVFQERFGDEDALISENMRRALAGFYTNLDEMDTVDELFGGWLREDPQWGWGWTGWSDCYYILRKERNADKAEQLLVQGLAVAGVRDEVDMLDRLQTLYSELGREKEAREVRGRLKKIEPVGVSALDTEPQVPVRVTKVGRNEPCPCGSGRKYKKCCGA